MNKVLPLVAAALLVSGCQTTNPYTGETEFNNTSTGAALGALGGAVVGALANGKDGALAGAAIGAAGGAGWGYYMDRQEAELRARLQGTGVRVQRSGDNLKLIMPGNVTFPTNGYDVRSDFYPVLGSVALVFKEFDKNGIEVRGYTDNTGGYQYNVDLSVKRAQSVATYLMNQGVAGNRMSVYGLGPEQPIASNSTTQGRSLNRRVEIDLRPPMQP